MKWFCGARARRRGQAARAALALALFGLAAGCGPRAVPDEGRPGQLAAAGDPAPPDPPPPGRLGDAVVPRRARLTVDIDPRRESFSGRIEIELDIARPVAAIWLHARDLEIAGAALAMAGGELTLTRLEPPAYAPDLLGLAIGRRVGPGRARLRIDYRGRFGDRLGLFRQRLDGQWYAYTDFEPVDARAAMPCFDDPRFKIPWQVSLRVPEGQLALANTAPVREASRGGVRTVEFAETAPLPSYLVAFAVGPFEVVRAEGKSSIPIRVVVPRGYAGQARHALEAAPALLALAEKYMGGAVPWPKLDFIAVPVLSGAMENPGLITVSRHILLIDPAEGQGEVLRGRVRFLRVVLAHEIAHLWFGDLVTMEYWDELWLNEGLATWISSRLVEQLDPSAAGELIELDDKAHAARLDARPGGRRVRQPVRVDREAAQQFGMTTYRKGGAIMAMFEALIGADTMRAALRRYVAAHAGGVVRTADLAAALSDASGMELGPALASFLDQPGIPLVTAQLECRAGARPRVRLAQSGFALLGAPAEAAARQRAQRWQVPVCVRFEGGSAPVCSLLAEERGEIELPADRCPRWIHPNPGERGYYHYTIPGDGLRALAAAPLTAREQAGLAENLHAILRAGAAPLPAALDALVELGRRGDPMAVLRSLEAWDLVARSVVEPAQRGSLGRRLAVYAPLARKLGLARRPGDGKLTRLLRGALLPAVGRLVGDRALQRAALDRLDAWLRDAAAAPAREELELLYRLAPLAGGAELFERLIAVGRGRASPAVAGFRDPALVRRALADVAAGELPPKGALDLLGGLMADPAVQPLALPVALEKFAALAGRLSDTERPEAAGIFAAVCRAGDRGRVEEALRAVLARGDGLHPAAEAVLARIDECIAFRKHYLAAARAYFK